MLTILLGTVVSAGKASAQVAAQITAPAPGSKLYLPTVGFAWTSAAGASAYRLTLDTVPGGTGLADSGQMTSTNYTVHNVPTTGVTVFARLYTLINGTWLFQDASYVTAANPVVRFQGSGSGVKNYADPNSGRTQSVSYNFTVDFTVTTQNPRQNGIYVDYDLSRKTGTVHFWGTATDVFNGATNIINFDRTQNVDNGVIEGLFSYSTVQSNDDFIAFNVGPSIDVPYLNSVIYQESLKRVRLSMTMPSPFNLGLIDNSSYDGTATDGFATPCVFTVFPERKNLVPGDTIQIYARTPVNPGMSLQWSVVPVKNSTAEAQITSSAAPAQTASLSDVRGSGDLLLRVVNPSIPGCQIQVPLTVGCGCDAGSGNGACSLKGNYQVSSIDASWGLGRTTRGNPVGRLQLKADNALPDNATPRTLSLLLTDDTMETLYGTGNVLRQVVTPEILVDVSAANAYKYTITYYRAADKGSKVGGFYQPLSGAAPIKSIVIENPDASATVYNRLKITETQDTVVETHEYLWDSGAGRWVLNNGGGLQSIAVSQTVVGADRTVSQTVTGTGGAAASRTDTTYTTIPSPSGLVEKVSKVVEDPQGAARTTVSVWDTAGSANLLSQTFPDGSWVRYEYDAQGRVAEEIRSWLDAPAGAAKNAAHEIINSYAAQDASDAQLPEDARRPRLITEKILGQTVAKTFYVYQRAANGTRTAIVERAKTPTAAYGAAGNLRTTTVTNPFVAGGVASWRPATVTMPDGTMDTYSYEYGTYAPNADPTKPGTFTAGAGTDERISIVHGLASQFMGIANKSTAERHVSNFKGEELLEQRFVYDGTGPRLTGTTVWRYDDTGHVIQVNHSDGTRTDTQWSCCGPTSETAVDGTIRNFTYDQLARVLTDVKKGGATDVTTAYTYDGAGRQLTRTVSGGGLSLLTSTAYDGLGRQKTQTDEAGLVTSFAYSANELVQTVTRPGGATEITTRYTDGQTKSITGTGVVAQYYTYGTNADGSRWTLVNNTAAASPSYEKTTIDMFGRVIRVEKPGFTGVVLTQNFYNDQGRLVRTSTTGQADTLYEYDAVGNPSRSGLDRNANGLLDLTSTDRISDTDTSFVLLGADWWQQSLQKVYAADTSAVATTISIQRSKLTGLGVANQTAEALAVEVNGNQTTVKTFIDRTAKTQTVQTASPDSNVTAVQTTVNGLLVSDKSKTGVATAYTYDALERRTGVTDPRTGTSTTAYNAKGQVDYEQDAAGNRTTYTYEALTGRKAAEKNALNQMTRFAYNNLGLVTNIWGDVPYPVRNVYDAYGRLVEMHTWRSGNAATWAGAAFPTILEAQKDVTKWSYQEASGLLTAKTDAAGKSTAYTYTPEGKLKTRTWARTIGGVPLVTTYAYDAATGDLTAIDYSDTTPDVTFTYDRLGRQKSVADAVGTRGFSYTAALQPLTENIVGLVNKVMTRSYATSGVIGRPTGFTTGIAYNVTYGYDAVGRMNSVGWTMNGNPASAAYTYVANSDLLAGFTTRWGQATTYTYEPNRNLRTQVKNQWGALVMSQYDYAYDALGRRTSVKNSGRSFTGAAFSKYTYDPRQQLQESARYLGTDLANLTSPVAAEYRNFTYDPIGNRTNVTVAANGGAYSSNNLNQYSSANVPGGGTKSYTYDADGNLTSVAGVKNVTYSYDAENRLVSAVPASPVLNDKKLDLTYDYQSRRARKVVSTWNGTTWAVTADKRYVYDGWNMVEEQTVGQASRYYAWGLDLSGSLQGAGGIGGLLSTNSGVVTEQYAYDGNGNVGQVLNAPGSYLNARYEYDAYGNTVVAEGTSAATNPFRFSTKYLDTESGLYYYGYRYYEPGDGRWVSRDPLEEEGGINVYGFVHNNVINSVDLNGEIPLDTIWDLGNIVFDIAVGDYVSLSADVAAFWIPYVPAGATKVKAIGQLVNFAKISEIIKVCPVAKRITVTYHYIGAATGYFRHTLPKSAGKTTQWIAKTIGKNKPSKFLPGWGDGEIKSIINKALNEAKAQGKIKPKDLDGYIFNVGSEVGASQGKMTTKVKIHINDDGTNLHAFPIN